jgi:hypothetical protein
MASSDLQTKMDLAEQLTDVCTTAQTIAETGDFRNWLVAPKDASALKENAESTVAFLKAIGEAAGVDIHSVPEALAVLFDDEALKLLRTLKTRAWFWMAVSKAAFYACMSPRALVLPLRAEHVELGRFAMCSYLVKLLEKQGIPMDKHNGNPLGSMNAVMAVKCAAAGALILNEHGEVEINPILTGWKDASILKA